MNVVMTYCIPEPEQVIGFNAAICYGGDTTPEANHKRVLELVAKKHYNTYGFAYASFAISGISRACSHQLVRVAHARILQQSQRYVNSLTHDNIEPPFFKELDSYMRRLGNDLVKDSKRYYANLVAMGIAKEDARYWLLTGIETKLNMTGNFQMWHDFLEARLSKGAQWEIKAVATEIQKQLYNVAPNIFGDLCP